METIKTPPRRSRRAGTSTSPAVDKARRASHERMQANAGRAYRMGLAMLGNPLAMLGADLVLTPGPLGMKGAIAMANEGPICYGNSK